MRADAVCPDLVGFQVTPQENLWRKIRPRRRLLARKNAMTRTRRIISFSLASLLLLSGVVALIWMLLARDYSHGPWKLWAMSIAAAAVARVRNTDVFVPKRVCVELPPNVSLKPPPLPACRRITAIKTKDTNTCIAMTNPYNISTSLVF